MINGTNTSVTVKTKNSISEDEYGNTVFANTEETFDVLIGWGATGTVFGIDRNITTTQGTIYLPTDKHIDKGADIYIAGSLYRQDGDSVTWTPPQGFTLQAGQVLNIKKVEG